MRTYLVCITSMIVLSVVLHPQLSEAQVSTMLNSADALERKNLTAILVNQIAQADQEQDNQKEEVVVWYGNNPKTELLDLSPMLTAQDFSPDLRATLEREFQNEKSKENMLLAGMAGVDSIEDEVRKYADARIEKPQSGMFYGTLPWAANLVRARRGDHESLQKILEASRQADIRSQVIFLLKELAYVPQSEIAEYIADFVFSEDRLEPVKPTVDGLRYAQYAAAALSRMLVGCPVPYKEDYSYTREEIAVLRDWLTTKKLNKLWGFRSHGQ